MPSGIWRFAVAPSDAAEKTAGAQLQSITSRALKPKDVLENLHCGAHKLVHSERPNLALLYI